MSIVIYVITVCEGHEHGILPLLFSLTSLIELHIPARALRALGLLLADSAPTVGWGKTFWSVGRVPLTKTGVTRKRKVID